MQTHRIIAIAFCNLQDSLQKLRLLLRIGTPHRVAECIVTTLYRSWIICNLHRSSCLLFANWRHDTNNKTNVFYDAKVNVEIDSDDDSDTPVGKPSFNNAAKPAAPVKAEPAKKAPAKAPAKKPAAKTEAKKPAAKAPAKKPAATEAKAQ